jgi:Lrp/AsnC family transcriptional regulator, leucine-responsive regulatory protein
MSMPRLDAVDERILRLLVENARAPFAELAAAVGLSANAVAQRVRRLEREGVVRGYTAVVHAPTDGAAAVAAVVQLRTVIDVDAGRLEERLAEFPQVVEVLDLAGTVDYQVRVRCRDQRELYELLQRIRLLPGVAAMETRPVLREVLRRG